MGTTLSYPALAVVIHAPVGSIKAHSSMMFLLQILGLALTITAGAVLKEAAPDKPDTSEAGKLEASLSLFNYAGDIKEFSDTAIAKVNIHPILLMLYTFIYAD